MFAGPPADVYALPVETGTSRTCRRPALIPWVMRRFNPSMRRKRLSIAFAIAKNIKKRGTQGQHMFAENGRGTRREDAGIFEHEIAESMRTVGGLS
jgi:hypothetical protein